MMTMIWSPADYNETVRAAEAVMTCRCAHTRLEHMPGDGPCAQCPCPEFRRAVDR